MASSIGAQVKVLLESTFDNVANETVYCVSPDVTYEFLAIVHDEVSRLRREEMSADNFEGIINKNSKRVILLDRDIKAQGLSSLDPTWYFSIREKRYDFSTVAPFCDSMTTPYADAGDVFSVFYVRRAEELESVIDSDSTEEFSFDSWTLSGNN